MDARWYIVWPLVVAQVGSMSELLSTSPTRDRCGIRLSVDVDSLVLVESRGRSKAMTADAT